MNQSDTFRQMGHSGLCKKQNKTSLKKWVPRWKKITASTEVYPGTFLINAVFFLHKSHPLFSQQTFFFNLHIYKK